MVVHLGMAVVAMHLALGAPARPDSLPPSSVPAKKSAVATSREFVGDRACRSCHQDEARLYASTAHYRTSRLPSAQSIEGKFVPGANDLQTGNPYLHFEMRALHGEYFESSVVELSPSPPLRHTERIDIVVGSGRKGQTYLYWKGDELFELPASYWREKEFDGWINSPGYPDDVPRFDKPIVPRCLECHATSFQFVPASLNRFDKMRMVLGLTCEKCHGPGSEHVALAGAKSKPKVGKSSAGKPGGICQLTSLPRERQIALCAQCHSGAGEETAPPLSFRPGDRIEDFLTIPVSPSGAVDVHGNQVQLMEKSQCFRRSGTMTCTTCHDVHRQQRDAAAFSRQCLSCHKAESCGEFAKIGPTISQDCVNCHMPLQKSETLVSTTRGKEIRPLVRNHRIAIYPAVAERGD